MAAPGLLTAVKPPALRERYDWGVDSYEIGTAFGHIAIGVPDVYEAREKMKQVGGEIIRDAGPMNAGDTIIAFLEDPDGYQIELIGRA